MTLQGRREATTRDVIPAKAGISMIDHVASKRNVIPAKAGIQEAKPCE